MNYRTSPYHLFAFTVTFIAAFTVTAAVMVMITVTVTVIVTDTVAVAVAAAAAAEVKVMDLGQCNMLQGSSGSGCNKMGKQHTVLST